MMSSIVVDHLHTEFEKDAGVGIAYIFCSYQPQQEQRPEDLLLSLLKQLVEERRAIPQNVKILYDCHRIKGTRPSLEEIVRELDSVIQLYSRVFIVIDALDEYYASSTEGQEELLNKVFYLQDKYKNLQGKYKLNVFATSRLVPEVMRRFEGCASKEIRAQDDDIESYINARIPQLLLSQISKHPSVQDSIRRDIIKAAGGMYIPYSTNIC